MYNLKDKAAKSGNDSMLRQFTDAVKYFNADKELPVHQQSWIFVDNSILQSDKQECDQETDKMEVTEESATPAAKRVFTS